MPECKNHPKRKDAKLCMGCGQYFCPDCGEQVHGVFYCRGCEDTAMEFAVTRDAAPEESDEMSEEQAKWEAGFSSALMVILNRKSLNKLIEPLPLESIRGGFIARCVAFIIDWVVAIPKFAFVLKHYKLGTETDFQYLLMIETVLAFFYFLLFNYGVGMTLGKLFAGLRVVDSMGRMISAGQAFGRAIISFLSLSLVPAVVHAICFFVSPERKGLHDWLLFTLVVKDEPWKKMAKEAVAFGGRLPKKPSPKTAPKEPSESQSWETQSESQEDKIDDTTASYY